MITLHFHLQPQYKYELFHINFSNRIQGNNFKQSRIWEHGNSYRKCCSREYGSSRGNQIRMNISIIQSPRSTETRINHQKINKLLKADEGVRWFHQVLALKVWILKLHFKVSSIEDNWNIHVPLSWINLLSCSNMNCNDFIFFSLSLFFFPGWRLWKTKGKNNAASSGQP